ncbi:hypothetical protein ACFEL9_24670 [Terrimonas sp. R1]
MLHKTHWQLSGSQFQWPISLAEIHKAGILSDEPARKKMLTLLGAVPLARERRHMNIKSPGSD